MTPTRKPAPIKCVAPWAGGKRTLAPRIVELLGEHDTYVEPFVGGCSILPVKPRSAVEIVNDANPAVVNVLRCVRDHGRRLGSLLESYQFDKEIFEAAREYVSRNNGKNYIGFAVCQLVVWWMGANGYAGTTKAGWFAQRHTKTGGDPAVRWESFKRSLPTLAERLRDVGIDCDDFRLFLRVLCPDRPGVAAYVDPPYFAKRIQYAHDFTVQDHADLAAILNRYSRARIVVSYDQVEEDGLFGGGSRLDELYPHGRWERHEVAVSKASANARTGATKTAATEVLLVNRGGK